MAVNWNRKRYTKERLTEVVKNSESWRQVARELGMNPDAGGIYYSIKAAVADLGLSTEHFTGQGWNKGGKFDLAPFNTIPLEDILVVNSTYLNTSSLKRRLLKEGLLEPICSAPYCPVPNPSVNPFTGEETPLKLSLDHIDGDRTNNLIDNLRLLCYHCHGETDTWCSKNKKRYPEEIKKEDIKLKKEPVRRNMGYRYDICPECGNKKAKKSLKCKDCEYTTRKGKSRPSTEKIDWPEDSVLLKMVQSTNYSKVAKELDVSDNAVRKRLKNRGLI